MKVFELKVENPEEKIVYSNELYLTRQDVEKAALGNAMMDIKYSFEGGTAEEAKTVVKFYCDMIVKKVNESDYHPFESFLPIILQIAKDNTGINYQITEKEVL